MEASFSKVHGFICVLSLLAKFFSTFLSEEIRNKGLEFELNAYKSQVEGWLKSDASAKRNYKADLRVSIS
jgi:hypothetical protein